MISADVQKGGIMLVNLTRRIVPGEVKKEYTDKNGKVHHVGDPQENLYLYIVLPNGSKIAVRPVFNADFSKLSSIADNDEVK